MSQLLINWFKKPQPFHPYYFVVGTEDFLRAEIKKIFKEKLIKNMEDFNYDELSADENSVADVLNFSDTLPMLSDKRLLICCRADLFSEKDWTQLRSIFFKEDQKTVFVFFFDKKDGRKKHFKALKNKVVELDASPVPSWQMGPWLDFLSKKEQVQISPSAKSLFLQLAGPHLLEISIELKKLKQYLGACSPAQEKDILACSSRLKIESMFDLTDALGSKNITKSLSLLASLLEQGDSEIAVVSLLARHLRILMKVQQGLKEKLSPSKLSQKTGVSPYFLKNYLKQADLWTKPQLENTLQSLFLTDKALKSSPLSPHIWLENFILKSCS